MTEDRFKISADEMMHRLSEKDRRRDAPVRAVVNIAEEMLDSVMRTLGLDPTIPQETLHFQMDTLGITVTSLEGIGLIVIQTKTGALKPYAFIKEPEVVGNDKYAFKPAYWNEALDDFDTPERIQIGRVE